MNKSNGSFLLLRVPHFLIFHEYLNGTDCVTEKELYEEIRRKMMEKYSEIFSYEFKLSSSFFQLI